VGKLVIRNCHIIDPASGLDTPGDILIENAKFSQVGSVDSGIVPDREIDATGLHAFPGFIDCHVHFRDPGQTHKEDFESGSKAALAGGYTSVIQMPNTSPPLSTPELVEEYTRIEPIHSYVAASVTRDRMGIHLNDFDALINAGAVAFTDDGSPIADEDIMREALMKSSQIGYKIMAHSENPELSWGGCIIEGDIAESLGVKGISRDAESSMVQRDIELTQNFWGYLHVCHVSTKKSVDLIREAKEDGVNVTCEVTPHHLLLNHETVLKWGADAKMNPPLAYEDDRIACVEGFLDGTLDIVVTDHAPHSIEEKAQGIEKAPFGVVGLETSFPLLYTWFVLSEKMCLIDLVDRMSYRPARLFNLPGGKLSPGEPADLVLYNLDFNYTINPSVFNSKSHNTPFRDWTVNGKPVFVIVDGRVRFPF
jgi:dihydroorotase